MYGVKDTETHLSSERHNRRCTINLLMKVCSITWSPASGSSGGDSGSTERLECRMYARGARMRGGNMVSRISERSAKERIHHTCLLHSADESRNESRAQCNLHSRFWLYR